MTHAQPVRSSQVQVGGGRGYPYTDELLNVIITVANKAVDDFSWKIRLMQYQEIFYSDDGVEIINVSSSEIDSKVDSGHKLFIPQITFFKRVLRQRRLLGFWLPRLWCLTPNTTLRKHVLAANYKARGNTIVRIQCFLHLVMSLYMQSFSHVK